MSRHTLTANRALAMKDNFEGYGEIFLPPGTKRKKSGRPRKISHDHEDRLRQYLIERPDAYVKDMCEFLSSSCGIAVDDSTVWRCLRNMGWKGKKSSKPRDDNESFVKILLGKTHAFVKEYMSQVHFDASHDYAHVLRVLALAQEILRVERGKYPHIRFDPVIVELAALMHDIDDHKYTQHTSTPPSPSQNTTNNNNTYTSLPSPPTTLDPSSSSTALTTNIAIDPTLQPPPLPLPTPSPSSKTVETHLLALGWPRTTASTTSFITSALSYTTETHQPTIHRAALCRYPEFAIVQDADRLDALGAIGIGRAFTYGGANGRRDGGADAMVERAGGMEETIKHMEEKLEKLEGLMKTGEGKRIAAVRAERIRAFKDWWGEEMEMGGMGGMGGGIGGAVGMDASVGGREHITADALAAR